MVTNLDRTYEIARGEVLSKNKGDLFAKVKYFDRGLHSIDRMSDPDDIEEADEN